MLETLIKQQLQERFLLVQICSSQSYKWPLCAPHQYKSPCLELGYVPKINELMPLHRLRYTLLNR
jgi:hypothetical protein